MEKQYKEGHEINRAAIELNKLIYQEPLSTCLHVSLIHIHVLVCDTKLFTVILSVLAFHLHIYLFILLVSDD